MNPIIFGFFLALSPALTDSPVTLQVLPATSNQQVLPGTPPPASSFTGPIFVSATPGEVEPARLHVYAHHDLVGLTATVSAPLTDFVDVRVLTTWYQAGRSHADNSYRLLTPELLLKDPTMLRVDGGENYVRDITGAWHWISEPGFHEGRVVTPISEFPVDDADTLQPFDVAAGSNTAFWLTVRVPEMTPPGRFTATVSISDASGPLADVPLELEVLPFVLSEPRMTFSIYYRGILDDAMPDGSMSSEIKSETQMLAELSNMVDHGITNPTVYQKLDTGKLTRVLELREQAGCETADLFYIGTNAIPSGPDPLERITQDVTDTLAIIQPFGIGDLYIYARDEARGDELTAQREGWIAARAAGAKVFVAGYRTSAWTGPGNFDLMGDVQDALVASHRPGRSEAELWHSVGGKVFNYASPHVGPETPETFRRNYGLLLWQNDYDGPMSYVYHDSRGELWNDFDHVTNREQAFTYVTIDGCIDTIQWEGQREGVDDVRYLSTLLDLIDARQVDGLRNTASAEAMVAELYDAPLGRMDLDALRDCIVGHILDLLVAPPASSGGNDITPPAMDPIAADGTTAVRWRTDRRMTSELHASSGLPHSWVNPALVRDLVHPALVREHVFPLGGVQPGLGFWSVARSSDRQGNRLTSAPVWLGTNPAASIDFGGATPADGSSVVGPFDVETVADSRWLSSAFLNMDDDLIGWWRFDEADGAPPLDSSSAGNDGVLVNADGSRVPGVYGSALQLDGSDDHVHIGDLGIPAGGTGTFEGWFRFDELPVDKGAPQGIADLLYVHPDTENIYVKGTTDYFHTAPLLTPAQWHHIVLTWDGDTGSADLYVDGRLMPIKIQGGVDPMPGLNDFDLGRSYSYLGGAMDEVRVFRRVLSHAEVLASMDAVKHPLSATFDLPPGTHQVDATIVNTAGSSSTVSRLIEVLP